MVFDKRHFILASLGVLVQVMGVRVLSIQLYNMQRMSEEVTREILARQPRCEGNREKAFPFCLAATKEQRKKGLEWRRGVSQLDRDILCISFLFLFRLHLSTDLITMHAESHLHSLLLQRIPLSQRVQPRTSSTTFLASHWRGACIQR